MIHFSDTLTGELKEEWYVEKPKERSIRTLYSTPCTKFTLALDDVTVLGSKRCEISHHNNLKYGNRMPMCIYSVKMKLCDLDGEKYIADINPDGSLAGSEIITQFHNVPDEDEEWTYPPLYLKTWGKNYAIGWCWDDDEITTTEKMKSEGKMGFEEIEPFANDVGKWVEWKYYIKWGWLPEHEPFVVITKDGELFWERYGPNTTNDEYQNHFKIGIYKWDWAQGEDNTSVVKRRSIYFKDVDIIIL